MPLYRSSALKRGVIRLLEVCAILALILGSPLFAHATVLYSQPSSAGGFSSGVGNTVPFIPTANGNIREIEIEVASSSLPIGYVRISGLACTTVSGPCGAYWTAGTTTSSVSPYAGPGVYDFYFPVASAPGGSINDYTQYQPGGPGSQAVANIYFTVIWSATADFASIVNMPGPLAAFGFSTLDNNTAFYPLGNGTGVPFFRVDVNTAASAPSDNSTHFTQVNPLPAIIIATGTPFTLEDLGFINGVDIPTSPSDLSISWELSGIANDCLDVICAANSTPVYKYRTNAITSLPGDQSFDIATTADPLFILGSYKIRTSIDKPTNILGFTSIFGHSFGYESVVATTTYFTVGTTTGLSSILLGIQQQGLTSTTTAAALASCNPLSFVLFDCVYTLFIPSATDIASLLQQAHDQILTRAPWGYATRMFTILTNNATSTASKDLPTFVVAFPPGSPLYGDPITFNMQDMMVQGSTTMAGLVDPITGKSFREILEPYILLFIAISAFVIIFHDLMGMGDVRMSGEGGDRNLNSDKYREWLYTHKS